MKLDNLNITVTMTDDNGNKITVEQLKEMIKNINIINLAEQGQELTTKVKELEDTVTSEMDDLEQRVVNLESGS